MLKGNGVFKLIQKFYRICQTKIIGPSNIPLQMDNMANEQL